MIGTDSNNFEARMVIATRRIGRLRSDAGAIREAALLLLFLIAAPALALAANSEVITASNGEIAASTEYSVSMPVDRGGVEVTSRAVGSEDLRGWDHLYNLLILEGTDPQRLRRVLSDPRMPEYKPLFFNLDPRERSSMYRKHNSKAARANAMQFYAENAATFRGAELRFGVPQSILLALLQVETGCGSFTGRERVFFRLARLAAAAAPSNVRENFIRKKRSVKLVTVDQVRRRAETLQGLFLKHTAATLDVARDLSVEPLELRGSGAGAIGLPQFLPGNVERFGFDADRDGRVNLFDPVDAVYSIGRFLQEHGWHRRKTLTLSDKKTVLRHYNRSEPYVSTVLALSQALEKEIMRRSIQ